MSEFHYYNHHISVVIVVGIVVNVMNFFNFFIEPSASICFKFC